METLMIILFVRINWILIKSEPYYQLLSVKHCVQVCPSLCAAANVVIVNGPLVGSKDEGGQRSLGGGGCVAGVLQQSPHRGVLCQTCE